MFKFSSEDLVKPGKRGGKSCRFPFVIGFGKHSAQRFPVSKIYYSYRSEDKNYGSIAAKPGKSAVSWLKHRRFWSNRN
ncbi:hypothetical protein [Ensifer adhaerens]|uniref:hypothetical protein n=1 Tax=Ensifer adhaerens TaxID=106592 RepID=UPI001177A47C|nr:hypothetical protein [Ensifer adhaerens]